MVTDELNNKLQLNLDYPDLKYKEPRLARSNSPHIHSLVIKMQNINIVLTDPENQDSTVFYSSII